MAFIDKIVGCFLVLFALLISSYYTAWVILQPMLSSQHPLQKIFLDRKYVYIIPSFLILLFLVLMFLFWTYVSHNQAKRRKTQ